MNATSFVKELYELCRNDYNLVRYVLFNSKLFHDLKYIVDDYTSESSVKFAIKSMFSHNLFMLDQDDFDKIFKEVQSLVSKYDKIPGDPDDPLGRYAWPNDRVRHNDKNRWESDTKLEKQLAKALEQHFYQEAPGITVEYAKTLKDFLSKGLYSDVIKKPTVKTMYRGMGLSKRQLVNFLGKDPFKSNKKRELVLTKKFSYIPKKAVSSWSSSKHVAEGFAEHGDFALILFASVNENDGTLLQCDKALYNLDFTSHDVEHEIISLGKVKVQSVLITKQFDDF
jgi:hypothetical protein